MLTPEQAILAALAVPVVGAMLISLAGRTPNMRETVTLLESEMPSHSHAVNASAGPANLQSPAPDRVLGRANAVTYRDTPDNLVPLAPQALAPAGGDQPHNNMQPYLTFHFNIALQGVFPPRT